MENLSMLNENLEQRVKLKIMVTGIGNAGSQVAAKARRLGYNAFVINSSYKDLRDEVLSDSIPSFIIGNEARGAGKARGLAKKLFKETGRDLFSPESIFKKMVEESDVVFVIGSTAGGTGSGVAPTLIELLKQMYSNKIIIYYGILPKDSDSPTAQANCLNCVQEIRDLNIPFMLADLAYYEGVSNDIAYEQIGIHMTETINVVSGMYLNYSSNGMIDENDMRVIISEPGYMAAYMLNKVTPEMIEKESIQSQLVKLIKKSPAADINKDKKVNQLGVIVNAPEEVVESSKTGNYDELNEYVGIPYGVFENYSTSNTSSGQFIVLYSGMNVSMARLERSKAKIEAKKKQDEILAKKAQINLTDGIDSQTYGRSDFDFLSRKTDEDESKKESVLDSFFN